ncbi:hypothetical protein [Streptomyces sp. NRRL F-5135]|uniref:hypothetical protein n=1 Tax=Streptomyces sp. NRRL F-5135 TaxID=1463858 RepID=UPI000AB306CA|nr:hypothetical protein [Streptomyces sp. NRRL F-5135]
MGTQSQSRYQPNEMVQYMGSIAPFQGWLFNIISVDTSTGSQPYYELRHPVWNVRLGRVRESSLRGPDNE